MLKYLRIFFVFTILCISVSGFAQTNLTFAATCNGQVDFRLHINFGQIALTNPMFFKGPSQSMHLNLQTPKNSRFAVVGRDVSNFSVGLRVQDVDCVVAPTHYPYSGTSTTMKYKVYMDDNYILTTTGNLGQANPPFL